MMRLKISLCVCIALLGFNISNAQSVPLFTAQLNEVTVYRSGASLSHSVKLNLPVGTSELLIDNVAQTIDESSIQLSTPANVTVLSVMIDRSETSPKILPQESAEQLSLTSLIKETQQALQKAQNRIIAYEKSLQLLEQNQVIGSQNNGVNSTELAKLTELYLNKQVDLRDKITEQRLLEKDYNTKLQNLNTELATLVPKVNNTSHSNKLRLQVMSSIALNAEINLSYMSNAATWTAAYDLKAEKLNQPIDLMYKAIVQQNTGIDWQKVKLSLSTGNPNLGNIAPILSTWYLQFGQPDYYKKMKEKEQVVLNTIQSSRAEMHKADKSSSVSNFMYTEENAVATTFNIDLPYNIKSNNLAHAVALQSHQLSTVYKYYAVPRMDPGVFLLAEVTDFEQLNLMPGQANILFENKYVGKTTIDPYTTEDTLNLSMGRDQRVIVKREKIVDKNGLKISGANKKQTLTYEISVKNGKSEQIELLLKDQIPSSADNTVEIELINADNAILNNANGVLTWRLNLKPGETQKVRFSYTVKYPKGKVINNL